MVAIPTLCIVGFVLAAVGFLFIYWASSRNLKDVAMGAGLTAAWTLLWHRRRPGVPEEFTSRIDEVRAQETHVGRAKVMAGYAAKHVVAQVASVVGMLLLALGALLAAVGVLWQ